MIGGGNVAVDVALSARRLGAERVTIVALEAACDLPAFAHELDRARDEGVEIVDSCGVVDVVTDDARRLAGLRLAACTCVFDEAGRFAPVLDASQLTTIAADQVVLAIGQTVELGPLARGTGPLDPGLTVERGRLAADPETGATGLPGVYAGGDAVSGPASVIAAIAAGRRAVAAIDAHLGVTAAEPESAQRATSAAGHQTAAGRALQHFSTDCLHGSARHMPEEVGRTTRAFGHEDAPSGLTADQAGAEGQRCFNCGCVAATPSDLGPALVALDAVVATTAREIAAEDFFAARVSSSSVLAPGELVTGVHVPSPAPGSHAAYEKFRLRKAIDFPILGVACAVSVVEGVVTGARVVLGAAAPIPVRAAAAEEYLRGRVLDSSTARQAGRLAVTSCLPLEANGYKVAIAAELVRRALVRAAGKL